MKTWTLSAMNGYYRDPPVTYLSVGQTEGAHLPIVSKGYYIVPHCEPDCCGEYGELTTASLGPFDTRDIAREWSCANLIDRG
jgi:hypothetical protein